MESFFYLCQSDICRDCRQYKQHKEAHEFRLMQQHNHKKIAKDHYVFLLEGRKFILFDIFILLNYKWQNSRRTAGERPYVESSLKP